MIQIGSEVQKGECKKMFVYSQLCPVGLSGRDHLCCGMDYISAPWTAALSPSLGQTASNRILNFPEAASMILL